MLSHWGGRLRPDRLETVSVYTGSPARWWLDRQPGYPKLVGESDFELDQLDPKRRDLVKGGEVLAASIDVEQALFERLKPEEQVKFLVTTGQLDEASKLVPDLYDNPSISGELLDKMTDFLARSGLRDDAFVDRAITHGYRTARVWGAQSGAITPQIQPLLPLLLYLPVEARRRHLRPVLEAEGGVERSIGLLAAIGDHDETRLLRKALSSPDSGVRAQVFYALAGLGDCAALAEAWLFLGDSIRGPRRWSAAYYIGGCGEASDIVRLEQAGSDPTLDETTLVGILRAMYRLGGASALPAMERLSWQRRYLPLVNAFDAVSEPQVKPILKRFLDDEDPWNRDVAAEELALRGDPSGAQGALNNMRAGRTGERISGSATSFRTFGASVLALLRGPEIRQVALDQLRRSSQLPYGMRQSFLALLWPYDDDEVLETLVAALTDKDTQVRAAARRALVRNGSDRVAGRLGALAESTDPVRAMQARVMLSIIDGEDRSEYFRSFLEEPPSGLNDLDVLIQAATGLRDAWLQLPVSAAIEALGSTRLSVRAAAIRALAGHEQRLEALEPLAKLAIAGESAQRRAARQAAWAIEVAERDHADFVQSARRALDEGDMRRARQTLNSGGFWWEPTRAADALTFGLPAPAGVGFHLPRNSRELAELGAEIALAEDRPEQAAGWLIRLAHDDREHCAALAADPRFQALKQYYDYRLALGLEKPILVEGLDISRADEPDTTQRPADVPVSEIAPVPD